MPTKFNMTRDINGYNGFGVQQSDTKFSATLLANTDTTVTVPNTMGLGGNGFYSKSKWLAIFNFDPGTSVWVAVNNAASAPSGNTFAATNSELNPAAREVNGGDVIHFLTTGTNINASVVLYSLS